MDGSGNAGAYNNDAVMVHIESEGVDIAMPYYMDLATAGRNGETPWTYWSWTAPASGTYTVRLSNGDINVLGFGALFDSPHIGEPTSSTSSSTTTTAVSTSTSSTTTTSIRGPATFYISKSIGNDSYSGVQAQNPLTPWKHIPTLMKSVRTGRKLHTGAHAAQDGDTFVLREVMNGMAFIYRHARQVS